MKRNTHLTVIGIDTGGTFTDLVAWDGERLVVRKVLSDPSDPGAAVAAVLGELSTTTAAIVHGTTVATNALLERRGARVALVTTAGFEDLIEIGRQSRPDLFALEPRRTQPLVPPSRRLGVTGPLDPADPEAGQPTPDELAELPARLRAAGVDAVAVSLLFSYLDDAAEVRVARALADGPWEISVSSAVLPVFREYERTSTTVANAYVAPSMSRYLRHLAERAPAPAWSVMASNAGSLDLASAAELPAACLLSGPAGGVLGATRVAAALGIGSFMTLDMGGTSTDVCLIDGEIPTSDESVIAGLPVAFPSVDIHTVGAGGGSIVRLDRAGALRVGPESAGAVPGPIAYGHGERPTVTDANLLLGRIPADTFALLGGQRPQGAEPEPEPEPESGALTARVRQAFAALGDPLGITAEAAAHAALSSVEASMARALRVISTRRGRDPRGSTLVCFGGAGPLHGVALAAALGMERVVVPPGPGVLSAFGLAGADGRRDYVRAVLRTLDAGLDRHGLSALARSLEEEALGDARSAGRSAPRLVTSLDLRYQGQSHEIEIPFLEDDDHLERFHLEHARRFGHADHRRAVELIHLRVRAILPGRDLPVRAPAREQAPATGTGDGKRDRMPRVERDALQPGEEISGPAVVTESTATTWLPPGWSARVTTSDALILTPDDKNRTGGGGR